MNFSGGSNRLFGHHLHGDLGPYSHTSTGCLYRAAGRSIVERYLPASHHSVNLLKCNGGLGIRTDSFRGCNLSFFVPSYAAEGLGGASLRAVRYIKEPVAQNKALYGDSVVMEFSTLA